MSTDPTDLDEPLGIRLCDALVADFEENADLDTHTTVLYRRPMIVLPEDCPLLCVYVMRKAFAGVWPIDFNSVTLIGISWQEEAVEQVNTLVADPELAKKLQHEMAKIEHRVKRLTIQGWDVTEAYEMIPLSVDYIPPISIDTGLVEGYAMTVQVRAVEREDPPI